MFVPSRFYALALCALIFVASAFLVPLYPWVLAITLAALALTLLGLWDLVQTRHSIRRNYPLLAHFRFMLEYIRPEIRQYFIESDQDANPFSRNQRSIVYQRAKRQLDKRPFGTTQDVYAAGFEWINHSISPTRVTSSDYRVAIGMTESGEAKPGVTKPFRASIFNISAMSFGALSANAIRALNEGARRGGFAHDTGEGSISQYHREMGGDLIWEIGSGYFGCRSPNGEFNEDQFIKNAQEPQVKMIEVKLSQGAKPGHGGVLPGAKVSIEIAHARGVAVGKDCISPALHSAFSTPIGLLEFLDRLRRASGGKPVGFKLCIGHPWEFFAIGKAMIETGLTPDFIVVDGKEGGTGAAPVEFTDHVGTPLQEGLQLVHNTLVGLNLRDKIRIGASGKIITAFDIARTMALGADWCNSARGFMFAVGCIQSQTCHTDQCPTGVATQDPLRQRALVVPDKAERVFQFHQQTLAALAELVAAAGLEHPDQITPDHIVRRVSQNEVRLLSTLSHYITPGSLLEGRFEQAVFQRYWPLARSDRFAATAH
jgi:glutamate synthase domain-containing protein 2